jgi:RHS repeat-associated protein
MQGSYLKNINYEYDEIGNITYQTGIGYYSYGSKPHAVTKAGSRTYRYDAVGNMTYRNGDTITYNPLNKPAIMTSKAGEEVRFYYGVGGARFQKHTDELDTYYIGKSYEERDDGNGNIEQIVYLSIGGQTIGTHTQKFTRGFTDSNKQFNHYFHTDALGSITAITDEHAKVIERRSYTPFGKIRSMVYGTNTITASLLTSLKTTRGFTGHEFIGELPGLVHMNARVYDSDLGRFLSADTMIPSPYHSQSYNRYSYLNNNPLGDTDSTGHYGDESGYAWSGSARVGLSTEDWLKEMSATMNDGDNTHEFKGTPHVNPDGSKTFDMTDIVTNESGDKMKISVHGSIAVDGTTTMAATLSMIKDGSVVSYGTISATFSPIGGGKAANGAKSASFANLFSSFMSISKTLAYEAFAMTPVGGVYDTLKQYNDGQIGGLMALAMLGANAIPGGAFLKRLAGRSVWAMK